MSAPVQWWCGDCNKSLHLSGTLWKSPDGDYRCDMGGYIESSGGQIVHVERVMHRPRSSWIHPALREEGVA